MRDPHTTVQAAVKSKVLTFVREERNTWKSISKGPTQPGRLRLERPRAPRSTSNRKAPIQERRDIRISSSLQLFVGRSPCCLKIQWRPTPTRHSGRLPKSLYTQASPSSALGLVKCTGKRCHYALRREPEETVLLDRPCRPSRRPPPLLRDGDSERVVVAGWYVAQVWRRHSEH